MTNTRILHVPRRFAIDEWGGTESVIYNLCRQQQALGYQPEIHTSRALASIPSEVWKDIPIRRYRYQYPFFGLSADEIHALDKKGGNLLSLDLFRHLLTAKNVRIYHAHVLKRMGGSVLTAARWRKKPCVVTLHGNIFDVPESEAASIVEAQEGHFEWGKPFGALFRSRHLLHDVDAVLCVGYSEYEKAKEILPHDRIHHLPNGVNAESFANGNRIAGRHALDWPEDAIGFGCLSRIDPQKNQLLLVEAFAALVASQPKKNFRLLLGGPVTSQTYLQEILGAIARLHLGNLVTIHPAVVAESELHRNLLTALDAFVLPSRHEPFGIVVLEAWASGVPVIASNIGGLQRLVDHEKDGLHFPSSNAPALTACMARIADEPDLGPALARAGAAKIQAHYTWKAVNAQLEQIYQSAEERQREL
ncbi:glycosyltransferase family 4 protein [Luteolibacter pohnpeiensis]|uniref:Glycosyltransferase family 4 protein n=1 Tax=Luteolibacter pohnpeiensis TaxID=454153 RepID=A0A934S3D4_9BACT|nr:glycosyltransferase family 4 protein [Luteolibacter pohnpeiensis]MBK1882430.1 glycosyltransferase family 4 protein [Luteolibacter pohnpeiensis]